MSEENRGEQTIRDFGEQWTKYTDNRAYYGSRELFHDVLGPLGVALDLQGRRVGDIGAGTGRFVNILLDAGARQVVAIEPSKAIEVLKLNTADRAARVEALRVPGDRIPPDGSLDFIFSIGVLHHIPEPGPVVVAARRSLKPGGVFFAWLYGAEGNGMYLTFLHALRRVATGMPHPLLVGLVWVLYPPLRAYIGLCRVLLLPLGGYMTEVMGRLDASKIRLVIYDQLRPAYAKYYSRQEAFDLFAAAGYEDIQLYHRHGYSWSVRATNPGLTV